MDMGSSTVMSMTPTGTGAAAAATETAMEMSMGGGCKIDMLWNWNTIDACEFYSFSPWNITSNDLQASSLAHGTSLQRACLQGLALGFFYLS